MFLYASSLFGDYARLIVKLLVRFIVLISCHFPGDEIFIANLVNMIIRPAQTITGHSFHGIFPGKDIEYISPLTPRDRSGAYDC
jgi:hypothetical protein